MKNKRKLIMVISSIILVIFILTVSVYTWQNKSISPYIDFNNAEQTAYNLSDKVKGNVTEHTNKDGQKTYYALNTDSNEQNTVYVSSLILITENLNDKGIFSINIMTHNTELLTQMLEELKIEPLGKIKDCFNDNSLGVKHFYVKDYFFRTCITKKIYDGSQGKSISITKDKNEIERIKEVDKQYYEN